MRRIDEGREREGQSPQPAVGGGVVRVPPPRVRVRVLRLVVVVGVRVLAVGVVVPECEGGGVQEVQRGPLEQHVAPMHAVLPHDRTGRESRHTHMYIGVSTGVGQQGRV